jgi:hypothetical protein
MKHHRHQLEELINWPVCARCAAADPESHGIWSNARYRRNAFHNGQIWLPRIACWARLALSLDEPEGRWFITQGAKPPRGGDAPICADQRDLPLRSAQCAAFPRQRIERKNDSGCGCLDLSQ